MLGLTQINVCFLQQVCEQCNDTSDSHHKHDLLAALVRYGIGEEPQRLQALEAGTVS